MDNLDRRASLYFMYRNPSASTVEVYTETGWKTLHEHSDEIEPIYYVQYPIFSNPKLKDAEVGYGKSQFESMLKTVKMLADWKKSHAERQGK